MTDTKKQISLFMISNLTYRRFIGIVLLLLSSCIDPVVPEFDFEEGLLFIDAIIGTEEGASYVTVSRSAINFGRNVNEFLPEATVSFTNIDSQQSVELAENEEIYLPPSDFVALPGETWQLQVVLNNGEQYESEPETILPIVPIANIGAFYDPQMEFRESSNKFIPGHLVTVDFEDPQNTQNYYYWNFRSFENLPYCLRCERGVYRNGICDTDFPGGGQTPYYDYQCDPDCWQIRYAQNVTIFSDEFLSGSSVSRFPVAKIPLFTKEDIAVEVQQYAITASAYRYYKVLKDIVDNNSSLNAPPPAALIGNMSNLGNSNEPVFGRFTGASTTTRSVFIDRTDIVENQVQLAEFIIEEGCEVCPPGAICPNTVCRPVLVAPCEETRFRTSLIPSEWIDQ